MATQSLPSTHRALVINDRSQPLEVKMVATPQAGPGSIVLRMEAAAMVNYMPEVYNGTRPFRFPTPMVTGCGGIARVAAIGPDTTALKPGQLVFIDPTIHPRDDPSAGMLQGMEPITAATLMENEWRDGSFAEYVRLPLENVYALDEAALLGTRGYAITDLTKLPLLLVPMGGLRDIGLRPGETIVVAPATGGFGSAAVRVALAMGATVIAMGRNPQALRALGALSDRVIPVPITGDTAADAAAIQAHGSVDAVLDLSPPFAAGSTHLKSAVLSMRSHGRVSLMGGVMEDVALPYSFLTHRQIAVRGKWMFGREDFAELVRMVENGVLKLGEKDGFRVVGPFGLDEWEKAFASLKESDGVSSVSVMAP